MEIVTITTIIEVIVMIGVIWNALLQTYWFFWSKSIHERKHKDDEIESKENKEQSERPEQLLTNSLQGYQPIPKSKDEVFSGERKYDPSTVKGQFDDFFNPKSEIKDK